MLVFEKNLTLLTNPVLIKRRCASHQGTFVGYWRKGGTTCSFSLILSLTTTKRMPVKSYVPMSLIDHLTFQKIAVNYLTNSIIKMQDILTNAIQHFFTTNNIVTFL